MSAPVKTYADDRAFLARHLHLVELRCGEGRLLLTPDLQGRVLTSSAAGDDGYSFGWINRALLASGRRLPHCNNWGGEDRFWLGPEGGQYALFFRRGTSFAFEQWQTPAPIDTEAWQLVRRGRTWAEFRKDTAFVNCAGVRLACRLERRVVLEQAPQEVPEGVSCVRYRSENRIVNTGSFAWTEQTGMPSIWILGQFVPSERNTIYIPYRPAAGSAINDRYFGRIGDDRLCDRGGRLELRADGRKRGKIGIPPEMVVPHAWALDRANGTLTEVRFTLPGEGGRYVNSMWEQQAEPFRGDVLNAYNDGPLEDGSIMGPFYELESSSPAAALRPGEALTHTHCTTHWAGPADALERLAAAW